MLKKVVSYDLASLSGSTYAPRKELFRKLGAGG